MERCPLCLKDKEIVSTHLIPQAMYDYCRTEDSEPIVITSKVVMQTSRQAQHPLLCQGCEDILNKGGENWLLPLLATIDKKFPLLDIIERFEPDVLDDEVPHDVIRVYAASRNPDIEIDSLIHFTMGVFWKASIHSWDGYKKTPRIEFGPYNESIRTFLLGETQFPKNMGLILNVLPREKALIGFSLPYRNQDRQCHSFTFHIPGILCVLKVGKNIDQEIAEMCFAPHPAHPILVADLSRDLSMVGASIWNKAHKSRRLVEFMGRSKKLSQ